MKSRYRIAVGGVYMDTLDDNLLILDIQHSKPDRTVRKQTTAGLDGYDLGNETLGQRTVTVTFELHIYDIAERNKVCQKVNAWAQTGGTLVTNDRAGQRLERVTCEQYAEIDSARDWTAPLTIVFATTSNPHWISSNPVTRTLTGKNASGTMLLDGNTGYALVGVTVTPSSAITSLQIRVGDKSLVLTGLSVAANKDVVVDYVKGRYLRIRADGSSVMSKLDPSSADNLTAESGKSTTIGASAYYGNTSVRSTAVFTARGCWL